MCLALAFSTAFVYSTSLFAAIGSFITVLFHRSAHRRWHDVTQENSLYDVATAICGYTRASAACVLATPACAWPHSLTLCSNTFFEECIDISDMHWHVTVLIILLAVAPLAALKLTLPRLCRGAVSVSPRFVMQASYTTKQLLSVHCARRSRSWHDGAFSTL